VRPTSRLIENVQLRGIAEWLDRASRWLEDEVQDNRERDLLEGICNSEESVETLTFLRSELDRMVTGFRRATGMLVAMTAPLADSKIVPVSTRVAPRSRAHLRLVK
jgi:hypothetical protein